MLKMLCMHVMVTTMTGTIYVSNFRGALGQVVEEVGGVEGPHLADLNTGCLFQVRNFMNLVFAMDLALPQKM